MWSGAVTGVQIATKIGEIDTYGNTVHCFDRAGGKVPQGIRQLKVDGQRAAVALVLTEVVIRGFVIGVSKGVTTAWVVEPRAFREEVKGGPSLSNPGPTRPILAYPGSKRLTRRTSSLVSMWWLLISRLPFCRSQSLTHAPLVLVAQTITWGSLSHPAGVATLG